MNKNPKNKRREAEVAAEHYACEILGCIRTVRAVSTIYQRQDMFSSDVLGKRPDGSLVAIQVTAGQSQAVTARKRKLEKEIWHTNDTVQLLQLYWEQGKSNRKNWFFKVWVYGKDMTWFESKHQAVPKEWFVKRK